MGALLGVHPWPQCHAAIGTVLLLLLPTPAPGSSPSHPVLSLGKVAVALARRKGPESHHVPAAKLSAAARRAGGGLG